MLFFIRKGTPLIVAKNIQIENFRKDALQKTQAKLDMVFNRNMLVIDPIALKSSAINKLTINDNEYLNELLSLGYYGFKTPKADNIFLINCKNIKII